MNNFQKETLYDARKKNTLIAYLLGAFFSVIGAHHLYLERYEHAISYVVVLILTMIFAPFVIVYGIMCVIDLFLTWKYVKEYNTKVRNQIEMMED